MGVLGATGVPLVWASIIRFSSARVAVPLALNSASTSQSTVSIILISVLSAESSVFQISSFTVRSPVIRCPNWNENNDPHRKFTKPSFFGHSRHSMIPNDILWSSKVFNDPQWHFLVIHAIKWSQWHFLVIHAIKWTKKCHWDHLMAWMTKKCHWGSLNTLDDQRMSLGIIEWREWPKNDGFVNFLWESLFSLQLGQRITGLRTVNEEIWKTLDSAERTLIKMIDTVDCDVEALFNANGTATLAEEKRMIEAQTNGTPVAPSTPIAKVPETVVIKKKADKAETEQFYLTVWKFLRLFLSRSTACSIDWLIRYPLIDNVFNWLIDWLSD